ncbi:MAG: hypothetical protein M0036_23235 [Desulfobacteraceae bacterium]|nr:hypothetical protein [Desulfobacteraceae bacterium]
MKRFIYFCLILTFCLTPLIGCEQPSPQPTPTPTPAPTPTPSGNSAVIPMNLVIDGGVCSVLVNSSTNAAGNQDFEMTINCVQKEWFHIVVVGARPGGSADGVDVDIFGRDFLSYGTLK